MLVAISCVETPIGLCTLVEQEEKLIRLHFGMPDMGETFKRDTPLLTEAAHQLNAYFAGQLTVFDIPIAAQGTLFQQKCWQALRQIPYGQVRTYSQQAEMIGQPAAARAVGMANHRNPLPIIIPCHRIIGANGSLTGYAGGLWRKEQLLKLEKTSMMAFESRNR